MNSDIKVRHGILFIQSINENKINMKNQLEYNSSILSILITLMTLGIVGVVIYMGNKILMPLSVSFFFALLLLPIVNFLENKLKFHKILSVTSSVIVFVLLIASVFTFLGSEVGSFYKDMPKVERNIDKHINTMKRWVKNELGINYYKQKEYIEEVKQVQEGDQRLIEIDFGSFSQTLLNILLIPIYIFLILIYRHRISRFLKMKVADKHHTKLDKILHEIKTVVRNYIAGLGLQVIIVSILTATGFYFIGLKYFIFLGVLTGLLNLIPYIGIWIASIISLLVALSESNEFGVLLGVVIVISVTQVLDNNILVPKVVGSQVSINALASILVVIIGGTLAGVGGMFIAIPSLAILKIVFDNIPELKPWGHLIGNDKLS